MEEHLFALLGGALSCPVKWGYFSDGETMPRVTMVRMAGKRDHTLTTNGLMRGVVQIDCWGATYGQAIGISREVRSALERYSGGPIVSALLTTTRDSFSNDATAAQRVSLTFALTYRD